MDKVTRGPDTKKSKKVDNESSNKAKSKSSAAGSKSKLPGKTSKGITERLYKIYDELSAATDKMALVKQYKDLLKVVQSAGKEKGLASQFISRFAQHFPDLEMETANALFDLCEDDDVAVRKQAVKDLVTVCKNLPNLVPTVADVFSQILQTDDSAELTATQNCLLSLFYIDAESAITGILAQIKTGEPITRARCFKFLQAKYRHLGPEISTKSFENCLLKEVPKVMSSLETRDQFMATMEIINSTKLSKTGEGRKSIIDMIEIMLEVKKDFCAMDDEGIAKLLTAADYVFPFFDEKNSSASLFVYFCTRVLPNIRNLVEMNENAYFSILKMVVELSLYFGKMDEKQVKKCLQGLLKVADSFMYEDPKSPSGNVPDYQFSFIESIFYLIRKVGRIQPKLMSETVKAHEKFQSKVAFLLQAVLPYKSKVRNDLQLLPQKELGNEFGKITCLRVLVNITTVGRELYFVNDYVPQLSDKFRLSWKASRPSISICSSPIVPPTTSRRVTIIRRSALDERVIRNLKRLHEDRAQLYQTPNGKFSSRTGRYDEEPGPLPKHDKRSRLEKFTSTRGASGMARYATRRARY